MCGLFGMVGAGFCKEDMRFIQELAYVSGLRGSHGSGVVQGGVYRKHRTFTTLKNQSDITYYLWYNKYTKEGNSNILDDVTCNYMMGHVRFATKGSICDENSHPFETANIIGMHNGTLVDTKYEDPKITDSEMMFKDISQRGLKSVLAELDAASAYAIVQIDKRDGKISITRNRKRDLWCMMNLNRRVMYYASESAMLEFIAERNEMKVTETFFFNPDLIYEFYPLDVKAKFFPDWKTIRKSGVEEPIKAVPNIMTGGSSRLLLPPKSTIQPESSNILKLRPNNESLQLPFFKRTFKPIHGDKGPMFLNTCTTCQEDLDLYEQYRAKELSPNIFYCEECSDVFKEKAENLTEVMLKH